MPEEKKDKKVAPLAGNEAKKDSFTFSDKIKNSKPAASKSFANRISSKIGSDGKPKKTLFERTKRDAPFFIAALAALLLLPFLYKYSGSIEEEPSMVTPGLEGTEFDPTRSGFDTLTGDPENQIAQLSGRDSLSLIKGFGGEPAEASDDLPYRSDLERSGFDDDYGRSSNRTSERNETNITRYRKQAAPATRAAFKKTNINPLRSAGLTSRGGGKLGVGMWGGGLKQAANRVQAEAPKSSPKPVSLQPLQAAGKPSRSYFGQGAAAEARRSKDAMSKANAVQALRDAQMRAIEPGKIGGILSGETGGPGGGNGKLERNFAYNGKEPWWWDMMKKRSQMEWEKWFNYKWGWIDWATGLAQKLADGLLSCLITGTDSWEMGKMFGAKEGSGKDPTCCGQKAGKIAALLKQETGLSFGKEACDNYRTKVGKDKCPEGWKDGSKAAANLGFFGARWDCMTNGALDARKNRKASEGLAEEGDCNTFYKDGRYTASYSGKYSLYHYIVGVHKDDWKKYVEVSDDDRYNLLHVGYIGKGATFSVNPEVTGQLINRKAFIPLFIESVAVKSKKVKNKGVGDKVQSDDDDPEAQMVALVSKRGDATPLKYKDLLDKLSHGGFRAGNIDGSDSKVLMSVKGGKRGKSWETGARCAYPLAFVSCHNTAIAKEGFGELNTEGNPAAFLLFPNVGKVGKTDNAVWNDVHQMFVATYRVEDRLNEQDVPLGYFAVTNNNSLGYAPGDRKVQGKDGSHSVANTYNIAASGKGAQAVLNAMGGETEASKSAAVTWEVRQNWDAETPWSHGKFIASGSGQNFNSKTGGVEAQALPGIVVSSATCVYGDEGELGGDSTREECKSINESKDCCRKLLDDQSAQYFGDNGGLCCKNEHYSSACCKRIQGEEYIYDHSSHQCKQRSGGGKEREDYDDDDDDDDDQPTTLNLAREISGIESEFGKRPISFNGSGNATLNNFTKCRIQANGVVMYNQDAAEKYIVQVLKEVNSLKPLKDSSTTIQHSGAVTVGMLVDAMALAYSQNQQAKVPIEVVCSMGKTIGKHSQDPDFKQSNNMFGAFAAYIDENSSFYPARFDMEGNEDLRFIGCRGEKPTRIGGKYHYGQYNWNDKELGDLQDKVRDLDVGTDGRKPYIDYLNQNGWTDGGKFPLQFIAAPLQFQPYQSVKLAQQDAWREFGNGTVDEYSRGQFHDVYKHLYRENGGCGINGDNANMSVLDALTYVGLVCKNGDDAKPQNGWKTCGTQFGPSDTQGSSRARDH